MFGPLRNLILWELVETQFSLSWTSDTVSVKEKGCFAISLSSDVIFSSYVVFQAQVTGRIVIISENFERKNWVSFSIMFSLKASPLSNRKFLAWYLLRYHLKMWVGYRLVRKLSSSLSSREVKEKGACMIALDNLTSLSYIYPTYIDLSTNDDDWIDDDDVHWIAR